MVDIFSLKICEIFEPSVPKIVCWLIVLTFFQEWVMFRGDFYYVLNLLNCCFDLDLLVVFFPRGDSLIGWFSIFCLVSSSLLISVHVRLSFSFFLLCFALVLSGSEAWRISHLQLMSGFHQKFCTCDYCNRLNFVIALSCFWCLRLWCVKEILCLLSVDFV